MPSRLQNCEKSFKIEAMNHERKRIIEIITAAGFLFYVVNGQIIELTLPDPRENEIVLEDPGDFSGNLSVRYISGSATTDGSDWINISMMSSSAHEGFIVFDA